VGVRLGSGRKWLGCALLPSLWAPLPAVSRSCCPSNTLFSPAQPTRTVVVPFSSRLNTGTCTVSFLVHLPYKKSGVVVISSPAGSTSGLSSRRLPFPGLGSTTAVLPAAVTLLLLALAAAGAGIAVSGARTAAAGAAAGTGAAAGAAAGGGGVTAGATAGAAGGAAAAAAAGALIGTSGIAVALGCALGLAALGAVSSSSSSSSAALTATAAVR